MTSPGIDPDHFREVLGHFATGVTVVTVTTSDGRALGMTVNSLSSVSLRPPLLSLCVDQEAEMHATILEVDRFVVIEFPSMQAIRDFHSCPEYQPWLRVRQASTDTQMFCVEGFPGFDAGR